jgi:hypothetical protein
VQPTRLLVQAHAYSNTTDDREIRIVGRKDVLERCAHCESSHALSALHTSECAEKPSEWSALLTGSGATSAVRGVKCPITSKAGDMGASS